MSSNFETYAMGRVAGLRDQAARLIAEADALENALKAFRANDSGKQSVIVPASAPPPLRHLPKPPSLSGRVQADSQAGRILAALKAAGPEGCTLSELYGVLAEKGVTNRDSIRSVVWHLKRSGKIGAHGDRYVALGVAWPVENRPEGSDPTGLVPAG